MPLTQRNTKLESRWDYTFSDDERSFILKHIRESRPTTKADILQKFRVLNQMQRWDKRRESPISDVGPSEAQPCSYTGGIS